MPRRNDIQKVLVIARMVTARTRSRLRRFSGARYLLIITFVLTARAAGAQITIQKPLRVRHLQGYVTDVKGNALARVEVGLLRDGKPVLKTTADETGWFQIPGARGRFVLAVSTHSSELGRDVSVGTNPMTLFCHRTLYVMARANQYCDDCSLRVFTSRRKFFDAVWQNTGHYY